MVQLKDYFTGKSIIIETNQPKEMSLKSVLNKPFEKVLLVLSVLFMILSFVGSILL